MALVGDRCVAEAVAEDDLPFADGWPNETADVLGAISRIEKKFRQRIDRFGIAFKQGLANLSPEWRTARLTGSDDLIPGLAQKSSEKLELGSLPAAVNTLECNQPARSHGRWFKWSGGVPSKEEGPGSGGLNLLPA